MSERKAGSMEGPSENDISSGVGKALDHMFMLHVLPVLLITFLVSSLGVNNWLLLGLLICYLFWIQKQCWERERRRIQSEERRKINTKRAMTEGETLRWLNEGLKVMWPISMEKFASQHFFKPMAPWFLHRFKPKFVSEVKLLSLNLGSTPPDFSLIRALPSPRDGDDVIFEAQMEFSGKDMSAQMLVHMNRLKTKFYISELYVKGTVKFSVKFLKSWPVIGRLRFCFEKAPIVDMTARPYTKNGIDMKIIPGAAKWLEETLGTALVQSVVEPYMLVVDMEKLVSNMMLPHPRPRQDLQGFFSVEQKPGFSPTVLVEILEAGELKAGNAGGLPDPIVEVIFGEQKVKTKPKSKTLKPVWENEINRFPIVDWELPNNLIFRVISARKVYTAGRQVELGICSIKLKEYRDGTRQELKLRLEKVSGTKIEVLPGWLRVAITVDHHNSSKSFENPHTTIGSQPTTQDIPSSTPPDSAATTRSQANGFKSYWMKHNRNSSTEVETGSLGQPATPDPSEDGGSTEIIKMAHPDYPEDAHPDYPEGSFSIQYPGKEESLFFSDDHPRRSSPLKPKNDKVVKESLEVISDSRVKLSMKRILNTFSKKRSKVSSHEKSPPERETTMSEYSGYSSSLDHSTELKVYHGTLRMNLQLPRELPSREAPEVDIHALEPMKLGHKLETILSSQDPESLRMTPEPGRSMIHGTSSSLALSHRKIIDGCTDTTQTENNGPQTSRRDVSRASSFSSLPDELAFSSSQKLQSLQPEKQNSKNNPWWKINFTRRPKRRKSRGSRSDVAIDDSKRDTLLVQRSESESWDPSDYSTTLSFRNESQDLKTMLYPENLASRDGELPETDGNILTSSRAVLGSQSCRQDSSTVQKILAPYNGAQSLRFDSSDHMRNSFLNTIHEKHIDRLDRPQLEL